MSVLSMRPGWSPAQDKTLRELAGEGLSASEIGRELGKSRNAIIGRATRQKIRLGSARLGGRKPARNQLCGRHGGGAGEAGAACDGGMKNIAGGAGQPVGVRQKDSVGVRPETDGGMKKHDARQSFGVSRRFVIGRGPSEAEAKPELGMIGRVLDPATAPEGALMVALEDLGANMCRWPFEVDGGGAGDGSAATNGGNMKALTRFCGCATADGSPWCLAHKRRATSQVSVEEAE